MEMSEIPTPETDTKSFIAFDSEGRKLVVVLAETSRHLEQERNILRNGCLNDPLLEITFRELKRERDKARNLVQSGIRAQASLNEALDKTLNDLRQEQEQNAKLRDLAERLLNFGGIHVLPDSLLDELDQIKEGAK
jgi:uncharacterized protein involved in exopolysaccharide biosynthesis